MSAPEITKSDQAVLLVSGLSRVCEALNNDTLFFFKSIPELASEERKNIILQNLEYTINNLEKLKILLD